MVDDKGAAANDSSNAYISATVGLKEGTSYADMKDFFAKEVDGCPPLPLLHFASILFCLLHPTTASTSQCPALLCPALLKLIARLNRWNSPLSPLPTACSASTSPLGARPPPSSAVISSKLGSPVCRVPQFVRPGRMRGWTPRPRITYSTPAHPPQGSPAGNCQAREWRPQDSTCWLAPPGFLPGEQPCSSWWVPAAGAHWQCAARRHAGLAPRLGQFAAAGSVPGARG